MDVWVYAEANVARMTSGTSEDSAKSLMADTGGVLFLRVDGLPLWWYTTIRSRFFDT